MFNDLRISIYFQKMRFLTRFQYGLPSSTETVDIPIKSKPGTQENRGWIRGWWMEPDQYKVQVSYEDIFIMTIISAISGLHCAIPAWHL